MMFRATVIAMLGCLLVLHFESEIRTAQRYSSTQQSVAPAVIVNTSGAIPDAVTRPRPSAPEETIIVDMRAAELSMLFGRADALQSVRFVPTLRDGVPLGLKVFAIQDGSALSALGFENGDTLLSINDRPVDATTDATEFDATVGARPYIDIALLRHNRRIRLIALLH